MGTHWAWPQYVAIGLYAARLVCAAAWDGEPRKGEIKFSHAVIGVGFSAWLLWCGGFFA